MVRKIINSKQIVYPLLAIVILIWGRAFWKVNDTISSKGVNSVDVNSKQSSDHNSYRMVNLDYDPFGSNQKNTDKKNNKFRVSKTRNNQGSRDLKSKSPPRVTFNGYIIKEGVKYGLFEIEKRHNVLTIGDLIGDSKWILSQIERDSCVIVSENSKQTHVLFR